MRPTRNLWISILFVVSLVVASVAGFAMDYRPVLGLDLEGGVSVILSAPEGTPRDVMDRALENIRRRVDAFGAAEPLLFVSGNTIDVQIPGLARGTILERPKEQWCLTGVSGRAYGCFPAEDEARRTLDGTRVAPNVLSVCLTGLGDSAPCFGSQEDARAAIGELEVQAASEAAPGASPSPAGPAVSGFCIGGPGLSQPVCEWDTERDARNALEEVGVETRENFCLQDGGGTLAGDEGSACFPTEDEAEEILADLEVTRQAVELCVVSSAGRDLGCFLTREAAQARLQATGQERLLQVIGTTARLEEREVLATLTAGSPEHGSTPVTCEHDPGRQTPECSFEALRDREVTFLGRDGTKYKLGPVLLTGDAIRRATAVYDAGGQTGVGTGWQIDFQLTSAGSDTFAEVTERLVGRQLAIVVDNVVISAPTVQEAITGGSGVITGSFTANRAKDLATQLNAGALPVNLETEQVLTVSPTLGRESLRQGLIAGIAGLVALALYLLFYYRLLAIVAWLGMTMWAVMALALVSVAGRAFGYTLTLAGVAGLVISLGVTADSYIVFFERLKDEVRHGRTPRAAVQPAFKRAYRTIIAADVVTALAAIILYLTAISSVRGFALTLGVATGLDLFVVYFFKRPAVFLIARSERLVSLRGFGLTAGVAADAPAEPVPAAGGAR